MTHNHSAATAVARGGGASALAGGVAAVGAAAKRGTAAAGNVDASGGRGAAPAPGHNAGVAAVRSVRLVKAAEASSRWHGGVTEVRRGAQLLLGGKRPTPRVPLEGVGAVRLPSNWAAAAVGWVASGVSERRQGRTAS